MKAAHWMKLALPVAMVFLLTVQKGNGFLLLIIMPFFLAALVYSLVLMIRRPGERRSRGIRLAVWCTMLALSGALQAYWSAASRSDAESALKGVLAHKERTGVYPSDLGKAGIDETYLREKSGVRYRMSDGRPFLAYPAAFMPLTMQEYDFQVKKWKRNAY